ncbi:hypothetical protein IVB69_03075, partial [Flavobacterium sp. J49]|uniref:hypothetical protein n=1 Tax=Flavobacterium sp. J49 TaxID=2718534 RepID=UPI001C3C7A1A
MENQKLKKIKYLICILFIGLLAHSQPVWQSSTTAIGSSSSASINVPSGTVAGDLLVVGVMFESGDGTTITVPAGWTLIRRSNQSSNVGMATYFRIAGSSEPATYTWGLGWKKWSIGMSRITGASPIISVSADALGSSSSTSVVAPAITTTTANNLILTFYCNKKPATYTIAVSGTTERYDAPNTAGGVPSNMMASYVHAPIGNTGTRTATASQAETWVAQTVAICLSNTPGTPSSNPTLCVNTLLSPITRTTTGATGIGTPTGLPAGVTAAFANNTITISGTPTASGVFNYSIP